VVVRAEGDTRSVVSALDPQAMVTVAENEDLRPIADDAGQRIRAALDTLNGMPHDVCLVYASIRSRWRR
jgi:hypothetical protein